MSQTYYGCLLRILSAPTGNYTSETPLSFETAEMDLPPDSAVSGFFDVSAPTKITIPSFTDNPNRRLVCRASAQIFRSGVQTLEVWSKLILKVNDVHWAQCSLAGPEDTTIHTLLGVTPPRVMKAGDYVTCSIQTSADTSSTFLVNKFSYFCLDVLGILEK